LIGLLEEAVGNGLANQHPCCTLHDLLKAFQVLYVECTANVYAGLENIQDILIALPVVRIRGVGMRDLVDDHHLRGACDDASDVGLLEDKTAVCDVASPHVFEPSMRAAVSLRSWVSMNPSTTSTPRFFRACDSSSMRYVLPTPAAKPM